ncbi:hypothetical protein FRC07_005274 [Ceratobasidium sp. 392]|nr:hypothetical protein FRC07_005274 [Ceratobasidium sp. 392]
MSGDEHSAYQTPPWTEPVWRDVFGLVPLPPGVGDEDVLVDVLSDAYTMEADGFPLREEALASLSRVKQAKLTKGNVIPAAERFMNYFWSTHSQDSLDGNRPVDYTISSLPADHKNSALAMREGMAKYCEFVLAMLNRAGGVLSVVHEVMVQRRVTPTELWKDDRDTNRSTGTRFRVDEYAVPLPTAGASAVWKQGGEQGRRDAAPVLKDRVLPYPAKVREPCSEAEDATLSGLVLTWIAQLFKFTQQGSFSLVRYSSDQGSLEDFFTNPAGAYRKAVGLKLERAHRTIIVADLSV